MAITVSNVGANDDWQSFLGQALGMYLGNRLNTIQTNRAQKMFDTLGQTQQAVTDEDIAKRVQDELAQNDMNMVGMDARAALASRKQKWADLGAQIAQSQQQLAALSGRDDPQAQKLINDLSQQIKQGQERQALYHDQAEQIRKLGEQRGWNLAGYGANDAYQAADNVNDPQYALSYADLGIDEKALQDQARQSLQNDREAQYLTIFDKGAYLAAAEKAAQKIVTPYARAEFLAKKQAEADQLEAKAQRYKDARAMQQVAADVYPRDPALAKGFALGLIPKDKAYDGLTFQPKGTVIDNGNTNVVTYHGIRPDMVYGKGISPDKVMDNQTRLVITDKNNQTRMRNVDAQQAGANSRAELTSRDKEAIAMYNAAIDTVTTIDRITNPTPADIEQRNAAMKVINKFSGVDDALARQHGIIKKIDEMKNEGKSKEEIINEMLAANGVTDGDIEFALQHMNDY